MPSIPISNCGSNYQLEPFPFVVAVLYLEYCDLMGLKEVYLEGNVMIPIRQNYQSLIMKYRPYFVDKLSFEQIIQKVGESAMKELVVLNQLFLIPGVRIIGNQIYYVGDLDESK